MLAVGRFDLTQMAFQQEDDDSSEAVTTEHLFDTWSFETEQPLSLEALTKMIKKKLPGNIYRCKGIVYTTEHPEQRVILQTVARRSDILVEEKWGERAPLTQIVAIGAPDSIDNNELTALFEACVAGPVAV